MERMFYSTGLTPDDFWSSTFDEVLFVIKGKVDDWRFQRWNAWKIVEGHRGSQDMPEIYDFYPLPYDDELRDKDNQEIQGQLRALAAQDFYEMASKELANFNWPKN